ncbi:MAG: DNA mismatch repair protein MutS [Alistipes sp.]|nr:DNA mismatch repair protein MutS [Candidatus Alistipes equi]
MSQEKKYVETPLMKQYYSIKAVHADAILLFRVGDFYETFGEDAKEASQILGITLTRRANGSGTFIELAGFPHHAIDTYMPKLVRAGKRVAICEQLEDPKLVKGLVKRGVIELVTPGIILDNNIVERKENVFLASVYFSQRNTGVAFLDVSTGEFSLAEGTDLFIDKLLSSYSPKEVIYQRGMEDRFEKAFSKRYYTYRLDDWIFSYDINCEKLCHQFGVESLKGFGVENLHDGISAAGAILYYLEFTEHRNISHICSLSRIDSSSSVWLDRFSIANLELFQSAALGGVSFFETIDRTHTAMGGRLLRHWIAFPSTSLEEIRYRQNLTREFVEDDKMRSSLSDFLSSVGDLERISSRVASLRILPRELVHLADSLEAIHSIVELLSTSDKENLREMSLKFLREDSLLEMLRHDLNQNPATNQISRGGIIAQGVNSELDELRTLSGGGKDYLNSILERETQTTGISSLKIGYNNVFGYYLEVRNTHRDKVPQGWIRKQTLKDAERYITDELKLYEERILGAEERILQLEAEIYQRIICDVQAQMKSLQQNAHAVALLDCLLSFAVIAKQRNYVCPDVNDSMKIELNDARHPVIETMMKVGEEYIPNDLLLDSDSQQIMMITGPNMSGKSALLRQTALIVLMAQIGSYVPATKASIGYVDKIFTRVGASDNISQGESTFMVEMLESASILNNISQRSLILLDEIGRGTSTYDGISIAWAMVEYLHNNPALRPRTLFATHYHELNEMEQSCERVCNYHVSVKELNGTVVFLRKLLKGGTEHSFGIHVAKLAGMPRSIVQRAEEILHSLEEVYGSGEVLSENKGEHKPNVTHARISSTASQLSLFQLDDPVLMQVRDRIVKLDIDSLTPLEALNTLSKIKTIILGK